MKTQAQHIIPQSPYNEHSGRGIDGDGWCDVINWRNKMKKSFVIISVSILCFTYASGQYKKDSITDYDGNVYHTLQIGTQVWMIDNYRTTHYTTGDIIPQAKTWEELKNYGKQPTGCWCYYMFNSADSIKYGRVYNYYAVMSGGKFAPKGWHIPSEREWTVLDSVLRSNPLFPIMVSKLPGGWWSSTEAQMKGAWNRAYIYNAKGFYCADYHDARFVICVKD
ncbi:MAG: fibrobacter succinogenes major paralogous domain-containing protein [Bacteroidetes bacterium]|nr:fibrobacter succinogenes major paralogous domain-containing protein [Bacteroidota bacterium]MBU1720443.1 fibrobacter succinogenes major paralogous domain-containing protein [Bacteroidota bacterium]